MFFIHSCVKNKGRDDWVFKFLEGTFGYNHSIESNTVIATPNSIIKYSPRECKDGHSITEALWGEKSDLLLKDWLKTMS